MIGYDIIANEQEQLVNKPKQKFVIGVHPHGFFSSFLGVIGNLHWADANDREPVVYWDKRSLYYQLEGYNDAHNVWEYYFEPVSDATYEPGDQIHSKYEAPNGFQISYHTYHSPEYRHFVHAIIEKYVRIRGLILDKIDAFVAEYEIQDKTVIGLHMRGTDKFMEIRLPNPMTMIKRANEMAEKIGATHFIVATDEQRLLDLAKKYLHGEVITYDAQRSYTNKPLHINNAHVLSRGALGEQVLIEAMLLSMCDAFVCSYSNVAYAAYFFNPDMEVDFVKG